MLSDLFHQVLYRPLFNALIALYAFLPGQDLGVAIVVLTVVLRLLLSPLLNRQVRSQRALASLQPQISEIRKVTGDRAEQSRRMLALYQKHGVNPASGCFPLLVQLPILWAMFAVLQRGLSSDALAALYPFIRSPGTVNPIAFGLLDLTRPAFARLDGTFTVSGLAVVIAVLTGLVSYWQIRVQPAMPPHPPTDDASSAEQMAHRMSRQMLVFMPIMTVYFSLVFPAGLALYWFVTTLVSVLQQRYALRRRLAHHPA